jgi:type VI secretion system lysozyme-like protein
LTFFRKFLKNPAPSLEHEELTSIIENLNNVLNTKLGYGSFLKDFGISDLNQYTSRDDIAQAVMAEVRKNLELYEPRLQLNNVTLEDDDNPLKLSFKIECTILNNSRSLKMMFDSVFSNFHIAKS